MIEISIIAALDDYTDVLKSTAFFPNVSSENGGVYTCKAENWAGTSYKDVDLVVLSLFIILLKSLIFNLFLFIEFN